MKTIIISILILFSFSAFSQKKPAYTRAKVITGDTGIVALQKLGIVVDDGVIKKGEYIIRDFSAAEMKKIKERGFAYEIVIADVQQYYIDRNKTDKKKDDAASEKIRSSGCGAAGYAVPQYFSLGSMGGFYTLDEILAQLDSVHLRFPSLASSKMPVSGTLTTYQGRVPYFIRLSNNPDVAQNKPRILYIALTHSREPSGMQQLFYFMYYLLENYPQDKTVKYILDNCEIYVIPCVNPDGYVYNQTTNPTGGGLHRKNMSPGDATNPGADLNRNYGAYWGYDDIGSSPDPSSDAYRGTAGFSEAETQMMRDFYIQYQFDMSIDYHCYSNLLIYPWSYYNGETPDSVMFRTYAQLMTAANGYVYGNPTNTVGYTANGCSIDWFYGEQSTKPKVISFAPEAGDQNDGFWPQVSRIEEICAVNLEANLLLALFSTYYCDVKNVSNIFCNATDYAGFDLKGLGMQLPGNITVSLVPVAGIESAGPAVVMNAVQPFETRTDSVSFQVTPSLVQGSEIKYYFNVQTPAGEYTTDTVTRIFGQPPVLFQDDFAALSNWTSTTWGVTTQTSCYGNSSATDSPSGNYGDNLTRVLTITQPLILENSTFAALSFCAKWDIGPGYDYVEVGVSNDNGTTWNALCGKYTKPLAQNNSRQSYEGTQSTWINEWMPLDDYLGDTIKLRFKLRAGYAVWIANDGFYLDNLFVYADDTTTGTSLMQAKEVFSIFPNPADDILYIKIPAEKFSWNIYSSDGRLILNGNEKTVSVSQLKKGLYVIECQGNNEVYRQRFVKE